MGRWLDSINVTEGDTLFIRNSRNGLREAGKIIKTNYKDGSITVLDNNNRTKIYDCKFLKEGGHKAKGPHIYSIMHNVVGSNWREGIDYPKKDGSYNKGVDSLEEEKYILEK